MAVSVSLMLLLIYLNRFTHNLRPVAIADLVGRREKVVSTGAEHIRRSAAPDGAAPPPAGPVSRIRCERGGVFQAFDAAGLIAAAVRHDCVLVLAHQVGDFVPSGTTLVEAHGRARPDHRRVTGLVAPGSAAGTCSSMPRAGRGWWCRGAAGRTTCNWPSPRPASTGSPPTSCAGGCARCWRTCSKPGRPNVCRRYARNSPSDESVRRTFTDPARRARAQTADRQAIGGGRHPGP
ncbi:DUF2254 family protein [Streptomyces sp. NPDC054838]